MSRCMSTIAHNIIFHHSILDTCTNASMSKQPSNQFRKAHRPNTTYLPYVHKLKGTVIVLSRPSISREIHSTSGAQSQKS